MIFERRIDGERGQDDHAPRLQAQDGFDLGEGELAAAELEEELGADFGDGFGDDGEGALEGGDLADEV